MAGTYLVIGAPAVGKSTTSRALCARFPRSVHIPVDDIRLMVVSGLTLPSDDWPDELRRQISLARSAALDVATRYRHAGYTVVIDDFLDPHGLAEYAELTRRPDVRKVLLRPSQEEAHRRNRRRAGENPEREYIDGGIRLVYGLMTEAVEDLVRGGWTVIDTTRLTAEETVDAIVAPGPPGGDVEVRPQP